MREGSVRVASLEDLMRMKGEAGRTRDLLDLEELRLLQGEPADDGGEQ